MKIKHQENQTLISRNQPRRLAPTITLAAITVGIAMLCGCAQTPNAPRSEFFPMLPAYGQNKGDFANNATSAGGAASHSTARPTGATTPQIAPLEESTDSLIVRAQNGYYGSGPNTPPPNTQTLPPPNGGGSVIVNQGGTPPQNFAPTTSGPPNGGVGTPGLVSPNFVTPGGLGGVAPAQGIGPRVSSDPTYGTIDAEDHNNYADIEAFVQEARTGRFMFGVGVNSDAGVTGQIVIDERNFDWRNPPTSWSDFGNGKAFRGGGQGFRIEALPGTQVQRYMASFTQPYLFDTPISMTVSGFFFDRNYFDWDEQRLGGRLAFGYRLRPDLSVSFALRGEQIDIHSPRVRGVTDLEAVLGDNTLFSGRVALTHDTRDSAFAPTDGHMLEVAYEQAFGSFSYPRVEVDWRQYYLIYQRPDTSGRHTISYSLRGGITGSETPIYENFYAGGFSTLRGFDFRGASPKDTSVTVGGELRLLGSVEYQFPITPDDMLKGVVFCDFGTVEEKVKIEGDDFRVAPGFGLRIAVPALGPAPLALDLAFPVAREDTDDIRNFSFFIGIGR